MTKYKNPWHKKAHHEYGPEYYETEAKPHEYRGFLIYHRIAFDIVKDSVCVGCYAGFNGAKQAIDNHLDGTGVDYMARNIERMPA